jgi:intracellular multiplication protein IcmJ
MKLVLKTETNNWERFSQRKNSQAFKKARADVLYRDHFTCQYCYHQSQELEVINIDNNYHNNKGSNLVSACELCAKCTLLDGYGLEYTGGDKMIYLPEMLQEQVNQLCRVLFCKMTAEGEGAYNAKMIFAQLQDRAKWLDDKAACTLSHPALYSLYFHQAKKDKLLIQQLRWLPAFETFKDSVERWKQELEVMVD